MIAGPVSSLGDKAACREVDDPSGRPFQDYLVFLRGSTSFLFYWDMVEPGSVSCESLASVARQINASLP